MLFMVHVALVYKFSTAGTFGCKRARDKGKAVGEQAYINFRTVFWVAVLVEIFNTFLLLFLLFFSSYFLFQILILCIE